MTSSFRTKKKIPRITSLTRCILSVSIVVAFFSMPALSQRQERLVDTWKPTHFEVDLTFDKDLTSLQARTTVDISVLKDGTSLIDLDFGTMPVSAVTIGNTPAQFRQHDRKLDVTLASPVNRSQTLRISVTYAGRPADGLILTKDRDGSPSAIGDNWPDRVHNWIPCLDHPSAKASVSFTVAAPAEYSVVANGTPTAPPTTANGLTRWSFSEDKPVSPYNMVVAAGSFATATLKAQSPVPISYYVPRSSGQLAEVGFGPAGPSLTTFSDLVAPYPYKKLALIVGATKFGGMENANTIVLTPTYFDNFTAATTKSPIYNIPTNREEMLAHEIAHQWFGDSVTESTWADLWLSEGFATYFAGLFIERIEGSAAFQHYMQGQAASYLTYEKQRRAPIHDVDTQDLMALLNPNNYEKGGWVLHMLRRQLGDKTFFDGVRSYYRNHHESTASTDDLRVALEKASGRDLKEFFTRWIFKAGHPIYRVDWKDLGKGEIEITLTQTQPDEAFLDPVTLRVETAAGAKELLVSPKSKSATLTFKSEPPQRIVIDPNGDLLKEVK